MFVSCPLSLSFIHPLSLSFLNFAPNHPPSLLPQKRTIGRGLHLFAVFITLSSQLHHFSYFLSILSLPHSLTHSLSQNQEGVAVVYQYLSKIKYLSFNESRKYSVSIIYYSNNNLRCILSFLYKFTWVINIKNMPLNIFVVSFSQLSVIVNVYKQLKCIIIQCRKITSISIDR